MSDWTLTPIRIIDGIWQGELRGPGDTPPGIVVRHRDADIPGHSITPAPDGGHIVRVPIPAELLSDGVQCFLIFDRDTDTRLASFDIVCGDVLATDIRAEVALLQAELDLLKRAFRRHCVETGTAGNS